MIRHRSEVVECCVENHEDLIGDATGRPPDAGCLASRPGHTPSLSGVYARRRAPTLLIHPPGLAGMGVWTADLLLTRQVTI